MNVKRAAINKWNKQIVGKTKAKKKSFAAVLIKKARKEENIIKISIQFH